MNADDIKHLIANPFVLLAVAFIGYGLSVVKQLLDARRNGAGMDCKTYLFSHGLETAGAIGATLVMWLAALEANQLNVVAALGIGYAANSGIDAVVKGGRSAALMSKSNTGEAGV